MRELFQNRIGITLIAFIATVVYFIININFQSGIQAEARILLLSKDEKTAININQAIANAQQIPTMLAFYDKLIEKYPDLTIDEIEGLSESQRRSAWNEKIKIQQAGASSILLVSAISDNPLDAKMLVGAIVDDLAIVMSRYYNIKNELEIRKIEAPISSEVKSGVSGTLIAKSLLAGIAVWIFLSVIAFVFSWLDTLREKSVFPAKKDFAFAFPVSNKAGETKIQPELTVAEKPYEVPKKSETKSDAMRKASAPDNLPVGSEFVISSLSRVAKEEKKENTETAELKAREATEEEIRARLNKLLGGGL